jgi:hypothetical protein
MLTPNHIALSDNLRFVSDDKREAAKGALIFADELNQWSNPMYSDPNYTDAEISIITELRSQGIPWLEIRRELVEAGYHRVRSVDALKRAMHRRREGVVKAKAKVPDEHTEEMVDASEARLELRKLKRADEAFCKAMALELNGAHK